MGCSVSQSSLFSLLPRTRTPWREFVFSTATQACAVAILLWLRLLHPAFISTSEHSFNSVRLVSSPAPVNHQPQPPRQLAEPVNIEDTDPPETALRLPSPQPRTAKVEDVSAPTLKIPAKNFDALPANPGPVTPKIVATNLFSSGSSAAPTTSKPAEQVQTSGFGDPNGVPAKVNAGKAVNIASVGSFDLPAGAGYGNGTGGAKGARGVVGSSGFGDGTAVGNDSAHAVISQNVQSTSFGDANLPVQAASRARAEVSATPLLPAEIISKPTPSYTAEARNLRIQGEVLLEVILAASGNVHVVRVVRGLGHGLDDNAVKAAQQIRFKPAMRNGQPADSTAVLHIVFQLA